MATDSTSCYVSHLDDITKLIVWRGWASRNGLHMGVSPCPQDKFFNFTFVDTSSNSEVAILAPLGAPRICYQLKHKYIFMHISIWFWIYHLLMVSNLFMANGHTSYCGLVRVPHVENNHSVFSFSEHECFCRTSLFTWYLSSCNDK